MKKVLYSFLLFFPFLVNAQVVVYKTPMDAYSKSQTDSLSLLKVNTSDTTKFAGKTALNQEIANRISSLATKVGLSALSATGPITYNNTTGVFSVNTATPSQSGVLSTNLAYNTLSKSANYTILTTDFANGRPLILDLYGDCTLGNLIFTLPSVITGAIIYVTKTDATANTITISGLSTGLNTIIMQGQSRDIFNNSTNWYNH